MAGAAERRRRHEQAATARARDEAEIDQRRLREVGLDDPWRFRMPGVDYFPPIWYWLIVAMYAVVFVVALAHGVWLIALAFGIVLGVSLYRRRLLHLQRKKGVRRGQTW